ncbi:hypothetical protein B0J11DRAFT_77197 [Dendryphion nanum]|uniref:Poly(A) RNA polymerase mitochondrial-like central palm domain-containing protein n=1 Tax=Dendryphion nanum TaxID=256645 RepID=A0A9P9DGX9_9PLEO|nr:hypothetical protein B0J11DRAFT_77197 [Dendryphion nanum]
MQLSRARQICRSRNPFTPSIALWQHFILPSPFHSPQQQRLASSTSPAVDSIEKTEPVDSTPNRSTQSHTSPQEKQRETDEPSEVQKTTGVESELAIRRLNSKNKKLYRVTVDKDGKVNDYDPISLYTRIRPPEARTPPSELPWVVSAKKCESLYGMVRLNNEIISFAKYAKPTEDEALARKDAIRRIRTHVQRGFPQFKLEVFGSERTGLALATSDIDLRLKPPVETQDWPDMLPPPISYRKDLIKTLQKLGRTLEMRSNMFQNVHLRYSRYPLISLRDIPTGLDVQIVLANDTSHQRKFIEQYLREYEYLGTIYPLIKTMFNTRDLSDVYNGGFGSYPLFMMIVAALRQRPPPKDNAAGGLQSFLTFWKEFDTTKQGISLEPNELFDKESAPIITERAKVKLKSKPPLPDWMLSLRDPADPTNDLGRKGRYMKHVKLTCGIVWYQLKKGLHNKMPNSLYAVTGYIYDELKPKRDQLKQWGQEVKLGQERQSERTKVLATLSEKAEKINDKLSSKEEEEEEEQEKKRKGVDSDSQDMENVMDVEVVATTEPSVAQIDLHAYFEHDSLTSAESKHSTQTPLESKTPTLPSTTPATETEAPSLTRDKPSTTKTE